MDKVEEVKKEKTLYTDEEQRIRDIERSIIKTYRKSIWRKFVKGVKDYELIKPDDNIAVCISGGKDSMLLAKLMQELLRHGEFEFGLKFLVMDPGYNEANRKQIENNAKLLGIPVHIFETNIFNAVVDIEDSPCYLCARMRRGYLYRYAKELGCNKIALGHHFDDVVETTLMGMFYGGQVQTMMPKLHSTNFSGMELIRPMYLVEEAAIIKWREHNNLKFIQCACRFTENIETHDSGASTSKRQEMKEWIKKYKEINPNIDKNIFKSVHNINLRTIIGYHTEEMEYNFLDDYDERGKKDGD